MSLFAHKDSEGKFRGFTKDYLKDLARTFPSLKETVLAPYDTQDVHRDRAPDGTPCRVVLVGSEAWDLITAAERICED